ncbi:MAG TPA: LPXTG cell wall anchor domain-containing protein [Bacilli bacterium]|nr:LPXTG cell wall anchor domain-containing protein [Bacilli bacterium]
MPQTATNVSNFLVIGMILLSIGTIGFIYTKRKRLI